jgi:DNA-binding NtrC family response regulator/NAD-dependent dihydropyrimidine dehydrogenase PreA subunit
MKEIGKYLLENKLCDESSLRAALEQQLKLKEKGIFKPLGSILTESMGVDKNDLSQALFQMHFDIVSQSTLFKDLSAESIKQAISLAEHQVYPEDSLIIREGDQPESFYLVISGKVKVFVNFPEGDEKNLGKLGPGEGFGEAPLLTGEPYSASAKTITPTSLLIFKKKEFQSLIGNQPDIALAIIKGFASRLNQKDEEIVRAKANEKAYQQFISQEKVLSLPDLIGQTRSINNLRKKIHEAAENEFPALVQGDPGTEKIIVAGTIHKKSSRSAAPFLAMDAENVILEGYGAIPEEDSGSLQLEMAQSSVLFGYEKGAFAVSRTTGLGLLQICRTGTVVIENVDKLTPGVQQKLRSYLLHGTFETVGGQRPIASSARIIGTTSKDLGLLVDEGFFDEELLKLLQGNEMKVPPIQKRKSDLRLLVDFLIIMECFKTPDRKLIKGISPEAYQRIMEYDWPGNMDELQVVIKRAINLAQGEYLLPEDIFIGIAPPEGKYTINLLQFDKIKAFFNSTKYPLGLQVVAAAAFIAIFLMAFTGSQAPDSNLSLILVWGIWEPLLFISWFIGARIWCSVCPMGAVNDLLNRFGKKKFKVPAFIADYSVYFSALGLGVIIWAQVAADMPYSPMATGFLLLAITIFAILSGLFFERRLWCRYLCPLGTLGAVYSGCSLIEWRANNSICNSTCRENSCYKGDGHTRGCPLYQGPFSLHSNQNCILCGRCAKLCPNNAPALNLRIPGHELWAALKPEKVTSVFVPVILGTQIFRGIEHLPLIQGLEAGYLPMWAVYAVLIFAATAVSFAYTKISGAISFGSLKNSSISKGSLFIHAIIPLAFAFEIAYQLKGLLTRFGHFIPTMGRQLGRNWEFLDFAYQAGSIKPWQVLLILLGMAVSIFFLKALVKNHQVERKDAAIKRFRNLPLIFLGSIYIWIFVVM